MRLVKIVLISKRFSRIANLQPTGLQNGDGLWVVYWRKGEYEFMGVFLCGVALSLFVRYTYAKHCIVRSAADMQLNPDCVRDVLLFLEENLTITPDLEIKSIPLYQIAKSLNQYPQNEVAHCLLALKDAGFIVAQVNASGNCIHRLSVSRITFDGHEFIGQIRPKSFWERTKAIVRKMGPVTLDVLKTTGSELAKRQIIEYLNGNPQV